MTKKKKTPIFCINCMKKSGYYEEDFVSGVVKKPKKCVNCGAIVVDKPILPNDNINLNSSKNKSR